MQIASKKCWFGGFFVASVSAFSVFAPSYVLAHDGIELQKIEVVSTTKTQIESGRLPVSVEVIDAAQLHKMNAVTLQDVL